MFSSVYNILETDEVRPQIPGDDRQALVAHLDQIERSCFPDFKRSCAVDAMIWMEEIHYFIETGETHIPEDGDAEVAEWGRVMFRDQTQGAASVGALGFAAVWPRVIENWAAQDERAALMDEIERGRHGPYARVWLEAVERALAVEDRLKTSIERWRTSILADPAPVPAPDSDAL